MKKGFTLLEMLAVLFLLITISAIVVPEAVKRTNKAEEDTVSANVLNYIKEVETSVVNEIGKENGVDLEGTFQVTNGSLTNETVNYSINLKGSLPNSGTLTIAPNGKVSSADLTYKQFQAIYDGKNLEITQID